MMAPSYDLGRLFDRLLLVGPQTESGKGLRDIKDVSPVVAEALVGLSASALRAPAAELTDNIVRILESFTAAGEQRWGGSVGMGGWEFDGPAIARYYALGAANALLSEWQSEPDSDGVNARLRELAHAGHIADVEEMMPRVESDKDGNPLIEGFAKELALTLKGKVVKAGTLASTIAMCEKTYIGKIDRAARQASRQADALVAGFAATIETEALAITDKGGPRAGKAIVDAALAHIRGLEDTLSRQRDDLEEKVTTAKARANGAFEALRGAAQRSRSGYVRPIRKKLEAYTEAAALAFLFRLKYHLTEVALAALATGSSHLQSVLASVDELSQACARVGERLREEIAAFESDEATTVTEITRRPLYRLSDLHDLYRQTCGADWGSATAMMSALARHNVGGLTRWLNRDDKDVYNDMIAACLPLFSTVANMTADGFVGWLDRAGVISPAVFIRNSEALAPVLCRLDRAKLADVGAFTDTGFNIIGVPDAENSVFAGTGGIHLVSTGDPTRIVVITLKFGFPFSALWHYDGYRRAYEEIRGEGLVAQEIYPGFPYRDGSRRPRRRSQGPDRRGRANRKKERRT